MLGRLGPLSCSGPRAPSCPSLGRQVEAPGTPELSPEVTGDPCSNRTPLRSHRDPRAVRRGRDQHTLIVNTGPR